MATAPDLRLHASLGVLASGAKATHRNPLDEWQDFGADLGDPFLAGTVAPEWRNEMQGVCGFTQGTCMERAFAPGGGFFDGVEWTVGMDAAVEFRNSQLLFGESDGAGHEAYLEVTPDGFPQFVVRRPGEADAVARCPASILGRQSVALSSVSAELLAPATYGGQPFESPQVPRRRLTVSTAGRPTRLGDYGAIHGAHGVLDGYGVVERVSVGSFAIVQDAASVTTPTTVGAIAIAGASSSSRQGVPGWIGRRLDGSTHAACGIALTVTKSDTAQDNASAALAALYDRDLDQYHSSTSTDYRINDGHFWVAVTFKVNELPTSSPDNNPLIVGRSNTVTNNREWMVQLQGASSAVRFMVSDNGTLQYSATATGITTGVIYRLVAYHDPFADKIGIILDEVLEESTDFTGPVFSGTTQFQAGAVNGTNGQNFDGVIYKVAMGKPAGSTTSAVMHGTDGTDGLAAEIAAAWPSISDYADLTPTQVTDWAPIDFHGFGDNGSGGLSLADSSGNGHTWTAVNAPAATAGIFRGDVSRGAGILTTGLPDDAREDPGPVHIW